MLEQAIERLTEEVERLRAAVERQNALFGAERPSAPARAPEPSPARTATMYVDERSAAELMAVSVGLLRKWRLFRKGPPHCKIGRLVRYSRSEVLAWLDAQKEK